MQFLSDLFCLQQNRKSKAVISDTSTTSAANTLQNSFGNVRKSFRDDSAFKEFGFYNYMDVLEVLGASPGPNLWLKALHALLSDGKARGVFNQKLL